MWNVGVAMDIIDLVSIPLSIISPPFSSIADIC